MTNDFDSDAQNSLWADVVGPSDYPTERPLLAHYTSIANLEKILTGEEFWLSNPLYMNDWEELQFGMNVGAREFRSSSLLREACGTSENFERLVRSFDNLFRDFDVNHSLDTYILCLAEHHPDDNDGVLSMWRGYGANGGGVALVLDTSRLNPVEESPFIVSRVVYANHTERQKWIFDKLEILAQLIRKHGPTHEQLFSAAHYFMERLKLFAVFTKARWLQGGEGMENRLSKSEGHIAVIGFDAWLRNKR